jgi:COMPASS component SWD3
MLLFRGVLPGFDRRLKGATVQQKIAAMKAAVNGGQEGLDLVIQSLKDSSERVQQAAYQLLRSKTSSESVKKALVEYNPYAFFECLYTIEVRLNTINSTAISLKGKIVGNGSGGTIKIWKSDTGELLRTLGAYSKSVKAIAISPDGKILVSGSDDCKIKLWNLDTGQLLRTLTGHAYGVTALAFSPDGNTLASGSCRTIKLWNLHTGKQLHTLNEDGGWVDFIGFSPDGKKIVTRSINCIKVWGER